MALHRREQITPPLHSLPPDGAARASARGQLRCSARERDQLHIEDERRVRRDDAARAAIAQTKGDVMAATTILAALPPSA